MMTISRNLNREWWNLYIICFWGALVALVSMWGIIDFVFLIMKIGTGIDFWEEVSTLVKLTAISVGFATVSAWLVMQCGIKSSDIIKDNLWLMHNCNPLGIACWMLYDIAWVLNRISSLLESTANRYLKLSEE